LFEGKMTQSDQDIQVVCQDCGQEFTFTAAEAAFYREKSLNAPPKRCKACRGARREGQAGGRSQRQHATGNPNEYRSPMSGKSLGGGERGRGAGRGVEGSDDYRAPAFRDVEASRSAEADEYRSPAFKEVTAGVVMRERRGPARTELDDAEAERMAQGDALVADPNAYRSPGFRGSGEQEYRSPAYGGAGLRGRGRRVTYQGICAKCGATAHVPFEPTSGREVLCRGCYAEKRGLPPEDGGETGM